MYDNLKERLTDMSVLASTRTPADALQYIEELEAEIADLNDKLSESEALLAKAVGHIEWFISEDETNRGDVPMPAYNDRTWNEINEYWIKHLDEAIAFVAELTSSEAVYGEAKGGKDG